MELMEVPAWGGCASAASSYPSLPNILEFEGTSKTVRRRHHKAALELDRLVQGVVALRGDAETAAPSNAAAAAGMP